MKNLRRKDFSKEARLLYDKQTRSGKRYMRETGNYPFDLAGEISYGYMGYMRWLERELEKAEKKIKSLKDETK